MGRLCPRRAASLERWQVIRFLDSTEVGEQSLLRIPRMFSQLPHQGVEDARIEVRVSEDFIDQAPELKLQKTARDGLRRAEQWGKARHCGRQHVVLFAVLQWRKIENSHQFCPFPGSVPCLS